MEVTQALSLKIYSDQELIALFPSNEAVVMKEFIRRYQSRIYTSIFLLVKDKYIAEDLFQETFIKIYTTLINGKYSDQGKFLPWALRIAHNLAIDYFRKMKNKVKITFQDGTDVFDCLSIVEDNIEEQKIKLQSNHILLQLVDELPVDQKEVIIMRVYGELSFKEIADLTGVSINTALGRMRYGLINLKKSIESRQINIR